MVTVLLTGLSSLPGYRTTIRLLQEGYHTVGIYHTNKVQLEHRGFKPIKADITDFKKISRIMKIIRPEIVVHMAALGDVDRCETDKEAAWRTNMAATANLARLASKYSSQFLYLSTDFVFPGKDGNYGETNPPEPINYYGLSKLGGEVAAQSSCDNWVIIRCSSIYGFGPGRKNFAKFLVERLSLGQKVKALVDQYTPTQASLAAEAICEIIKRRLSGIFHIVGKRMSRYEFAVKVAEVLKLDKSLIQKAYIKDMSWIAKRPTDSSLDCMQTRKLLRTKFYPNSVALKILKEEYQVY